MSPTGSKLLAEIGGADSISLDPHKWIYGNVGCGCILYRDPKTARRAFSHHADYTKPIGLQAEEAFAFWDYGPELSRPFRALALWMHLQHAGLEEIARAIENNIACAKYFGELVDKSIEFEMLTPVDLSIFCFRYRPPDYTGDVDKLNEELLINLQREGLSYLSNGVYHGKFGLRGCVLNYRTTREDMEMLFVDLRKTGLKVLAAGAKTAR